MKICFHKWEVKGHLNKYDYNSGYYEETHYKCKKCKKEKVKIKWKKNIEPKNFV